MSVEVKVPSLGESIMEAQIGEWKKVEGEWIAKDETLVEIESDKTALEVPAPASGIIQKILRRSGESVQVGERIAIIEPAERPAGSSPSNPSKGDGASDRSASSATASAGSASRSTSAETSSPPKSNDEDPIVMPAAGRLLQEHGLSPAEVSPSGPGGRLLKEDVLRHVAEAAEATAKSPPLSQSDKRSRPVPASTNGSAREEDAVPMTLIRKRIAARLVDAQKSAALLTTFNEIDMSGVMALRKEHQDAFTSRYGVKLGFMSFFVKAAVDALRLIPQVNAEIRDSHIIYHNYCDVGVAVGGGRGLVVPILRNAERMSFADIERTIADFGQRAKDNKLRPEELDGGTFTISNGGVYGSLLSTPIVNPPQSGILGLHAIQERPIAERGQVVIRPMMYIALTYDHRIVDGREAVTFLKRIKEVMENPARMLLEI